MRAAVVTGASTGIGRAIAQSLAGAGFLVFAGVRKAADGERLTEALGARIVPLTLDVTDPKTLAQGAEAVRARLGGVRLAGLVCNAGINHSGPALLQPLEEWRAVFEVNLFGVVSTVQAFGPLLGAEPAMSGPPGRIVMISSLGGELGSPFLGAYVASKHALEGLAKTVRLELALYGVDVIVIGPGAVATPIWDKAEAGASARYAGTDYGPVLERFERWFYAGGRKGLPPEAVGAVALTALTHPTPKPRYAVLRDRFRLWTLPRLLPRRLVDRLLTRRLGLTRKAAP